MFRQSRRTFISLAVFFITSTAAFSEALKLQTDNYAEIAQKVFEKIDTDHLRPQDVLLLSDIDSTLILLNQTLGSEAWFSWQESLLKSESPMKIAKSFPELLEDTRMIYALSKSHLVQEGQVAVIHELQSRGVRVVCLTARGPGQTDVTLRELARNGLKFADSSIGRSDGYGAPFLPYGSNFSKAELDRLEVKNEPRPVSFSQGIYFTEGQHKGLMLKTLLAKTGYEPKLVVFVDNQDKQVFRVLKAVEGEKSFDTWSITFTRANENPDKPGELRQLTDEEKEKATADWKALKSTVDSIFPNSK